MPPTPPFAVISGISKGIGRAIAIHLARKGFGLIGCARGPAGLDNLAREIMVEQPGLPIHLQQADLADPAQVEAFGLFALQFTEAPALLINNAGIFRPGSVLEDEAGHLETMMQINLFSAYHLTRMLVPGMVRAGQGHVFNLASVASLQAYPGGATYAITKFAMLGFSRSLRAELRETGIRVTTLIPGATWSDSWAGADLPDDRLMDARDLAELVWTAYSLRSPAVVEEILIRPQLGDL